MVVFQLQFWESIIQSFCAHDFSHLATPSLQHPHFSRYPSSPPLHKPLPASHALWGMIHLSGSKMPNIQAVQLCEALPCSAHSKSFLGKETVTGSLKVTLPPTRLKIPLKISKLGTALRGVRHDSTYGQMVIDDEL